MSKLAELAYDIEQLYIEGFSPKSISVQLGCPLALVYDWLESCNVEEDKIDPAEWDVAFPQQSREEGPLSDA